MNWTVEILDTGVRNELIDTQVSFTKGDEVIKRNFSGTTKAEIDRRIQQQLDALIARDENVALVQPGVWTPTAPEAPVEKTPEEQAADAWLEKWNEFVAAEKAMEALKRNGITPTPEEQAAFDALKTWVADNRKPQYAHLIANTL